MISMSTVDPSKSSLSSDQPVAQTAHFQLQPSAGPDGSRDASSSGAPPNESASGHVPRPKRIACMVCRRRKLRCDGRKPSCGNCARLGHDCTYNETRKKSGPKRGYVKQLEARLAQVETLLKGQDATDSSPNSTSARDIPFQGSLQSKIPELSVGSTSAAQGPAIPLSPFVDLASNASGLVEPSLQIGGDASWEMIGLGLEESLPGPEIIDDLTEIYFQKIHPSYPMIHKPRYHAAMNLSPLMRPPICLRYIMWAHAAACTERYESLHQIFYQRARKYIQLDEMKGLGESVISAAHAQCWNLIGSYEFKMMYFPRAWLSSGRAMRLSIMMGLHRQDGAGLDVKQCIPAPRDWTEREERRRTFWIAFCQDRYASVGTGWPMAVDERDILTHLPASDEAFLNCRTQKTSSLPDALSGQATSTLSPLAAVVVITCHLGRNLHHLHRPSANDKDHDLYGEFWKRHRALDNIILNTSLSLPSHLRLPEGINDPNVAFCNMCIHTSTICLHQAAIFKAEKNNIPPQIAAESKRRCIIAADQITNIMKMISHLDLTLMNPFLAFCLYVAARVFVQYLKSRSEDLTVRSSLQFLISAMNALKVKNPLTQSFLVQLEFDLETSNLGILANACSGNQYGAFANSVSGKGQSDLGGNAPGNTEDSLHAANGSKMQYPRSGFPPDASLPSRRKPTTQQQAHQQLSHSAPYYPSNDTQPSGNSPFPILTDEQLRAFVMEMDIPTDMSTTSDRQQSTSDHSTPNTHQTSNSSLSPHNLDHPSPPKHMHQSSQSRAYLSTPSPNLTNLDASVPSRVSSFSDSTSNTPFSFPASWNYSQEKSTIQSQSQAQSQSTQGEGSLPSNVNATTVTSGTIELMSLDDLTWMQDGAGGVLDWNNWQSH
ncbi:hypothetical protein D8B26_007301 [Coccidioides posadasii str. Silveira]|uniref:C6 transcription factor n=1 Tax=Coccidioides posadasii (strain RMSCC 757 / Silveira) TaxID=443226 RepID=E9D3D7_COCPS|nr:C6 transcription factor [Coccidioides posadasii str. Silveira]QVM12683.1 hypothetical protein D8B26_007301 [Coccidioides posadasii str. Silveira]